MTGPLDAIQARATSCRAMVFSQPGEVSAIAKTCINLKEM